MRCRCAGGRAAGAVAEFGGHGRQSLECSRRRIETGRWRDMAQELAQIFNGHVGLVQRHGRMQFERETKLAHSDLTGDEQSGLFAH